jgi:hypothetical protein
MKKANGTGADEMRPEYKRSDFGTLVRGKYAQRLRESSNVVVIEPDLAKAFPNARAVNTALGRLLRARKTSLQGRARRSKSGEPADRDTMRSEYDFVLLDADVFAAFPNSKAVNRALRAILDAAPARRSKRRRR